VPSRHTPCEYDGPATEKLPVSAVTGLMVTHRAGVPSDAS